MLEVHCIQYIGTRRILTVLRLLLAPDQQTPINKFLLSHERILGMPNPLSLSLSPNNK